MHHTNHSSDNIGAQLPQEDPAGKEDFTEWLARLEQQEHFKEAIHRFIDIQRRLNTETDTEKRRLLIEQCHQLLERE